MPVLSTSDPHSAPTEATAAPGVHFRQHPSQCNAHRWPSHDTYPDPSQSTPRPYLRIYTTFRRSNINQSVCALTTHSDASRALRQRAHDVATCTLSRDCRGVYYDTIKVYVSHIALGSQGKGTPWKRLDGPAGLPVSKVKSPISNRGQRGHRYRYSY